MRLPLLLLACAAASALLLVLTREDSVPAQLPVEAPWSPPADDESQPGRTNEMAPEPPAVAERVAWREPEVVTVAYRLRGMVAAPRHRMPEVRVWLLEFDSTPDEPYLSGTSPQQDVLRSYDVEQFDLEELRSVLGYRAELLAVSTPDAHGGFELEPTRSFDPERTRLVAFDPPRGEHTPFAPVGTELVFAPTEDLSVLLAHELGGAAFTVEAFDPARPRRPKWISPLCNGIASFPELPERAWTFVVRSDEAASCCESAPIDTTTCGRTLQLVLRTRTGACANARHDHERGGTLHLGSQNDDGTLRWHSTPPLPLGSHCPECAPLGAGSHVFERAPGSVESTEDQPDPTSIGSQDVEWRLLTMDFVSPEGLPFAHAMGNLEADRSSRGRLRIATARRVRSLEPRAWLEVR